MADLLQDANSLRYYFTSEDALKDKDSLKDQVYFKSCRVVSGFMMVPMALQFWQISLANHEAKTSMYSRVRMFKMATFGAAMAGMGYEYIQMRKRMTYYDRFYPEPTEL